MNIAYEIATFRRPSTAAKESDLEDAPAGAPNATHLGTTAHSTPTTPMPPEIEIDDEFNLPISLALFILIAYILCGAAVYSLWEEWSFFESCYFVFVSMSTIGTLWPPYTSCRSTVDFSVATSHSMAFCRNHSHFLAPFRTQDSAITCQSIRCA